MLSSSWHDLVSSTCTSTCYHHAIMLSSTDTSSGYRHLVSSTAALCSLNEDFGRRNKRWNPDFRLTFQRLVAQIQYSRPWKVLPSKSGFHRFCSFQNLRLGGINSGMLSSSCEFDRHIIMISSSCEGRHGIIITISSSCEFCIASCYHHLVSSTDTSSCYHSRRQLTPVLDKPAFFTNSLKFGTTNCC